MPLAKILDLFYGYKDILVFVVESLYKKGYKLDAY